MKPAPLSASKIRTYEKMELVQAVIYAYLAAGGIFSAFYFIGALFNSPLFRFLMSHTGLQNPGYSFGLIFHLVGQAILRVWLWLPDYIQSVLLGAHTTSEWVWGAKAVVIG